MFIEMLVCKGNIASVILPFSLSLCLEWVELLATFSLIQARIRLCLMTRTYTSLSSTLNTVALMLQARISRRAVVRVSDHLALHRMTKRLMY